jgi:hypothetical protein
MNVREGGREGDDEKGEEEENESMRERERGEQDSTRGSEDKRERERGEGGWVVGGGERESERVIENESKERGRGESVRARVLELFLIKTHSRFHF